MIETFRGINYRLKVVDEQGKSIKATVEYRPIHPNPIAWEIMKSAGGVFDWTKLNRAAERDDGTYEGFILPGPGAVLVSVQGRTYRPGLVNPKQFFAPGKTWEDDALMEYGTHNALSLGSTWLSQRDFEAIVLVNPAKDAEPLKLTATLVRDRPRNVSVVDPSGQPVEGAVAKMHKIYGPYSRDENIAGSTFPLTGLSVDRDQKITFHHDERELVGFLSIRGDDKGPVKVKLQQWAEITGRFVDKDGQPVDANFKRVPGPVLESDPLSNYVFRKSLLESGATFRIAGLVPGERYSCQRVIVRRGKPVPMDLFDNLVLKPGEVHDLGDIRLE